MYVCKYIYIYLLGLCDFDLPVQFWSVLIVKIAVSVSWVWFL